MKLSLPALFLTLCLVAGVHNAAAGWEITGPVERTPLAHGAVFLQSGVSQDGSTVKVLAVVFSQKECTLQLMQNPKPGPGKLAAAMDGTDAIAAVNGGYFQADYTPVGLRVSSGKVLHPFEHAKLLSGIVAVTGKGIEIVRSSAFRIAGVREAIQSGPMLVQDGEAVAGLNALRTARRTIVATDGTGSVAIVTLTSVTLEGAAQILATPGVLGSWTTREALNLDGGSSTGLWVQTSAGPWSAPEYGSVRDFLTVTRR